MLLVPLTSKVVRIDRFGTSHRMFQFPNDPDCERKMGQICPQTKETILKIQLGSKPCFFSANFEELCYERNFFILKQHEGPRDEDEALIKKRHCANQGH